MVKHLPFPSACIAQVLSLVFLPMLIVPFALKLSWPMLALPLGIIIFVWLCDLVVFVLSFFVGWNVLVQINEIGISDKKSTMHPWSTVVDISFKRGLPTSYGMAYERIIIRYTDGKTIRIEPCDPLTKKVHAFCRDEAFLSLFDKSIADLGS